MIGKTNPPAKASAPGNVVVAPGQLILFKREGNFAALPEPADRLIMNFQNRLIHADYLGGALTDEESFSIDIENPFLDETPIR